MKRTITHLADGRELIYFDRRDDADRSAIDRRALGPRPVASELRYDPLTDEWVAIAGHRQTRTFLPSGRRVPALPVVRDAVVGDPGARLRRGGVREPLPVFHRKFRVL